MSQLRTLLSVSIILLNGVFTWGQNSPLQQGLEHLEAGRFSDALVAFARFKEENPTDVRGYIHSGIAMIRAGQLNDASIELNQALQLGTSSAGEGLQLAEALIELNYPGFAAQVLEPLERQGEITDRGLWVLADAYFRQRRFDETIDALQRLEARGTFNREEIELLRGSTYLMLGKLEDAMVAFEQVAQSNPKSAAAFHGLAEATYRGNNPEAAYEMSTRAVALEPENPIYVHLFGVVAHANGKEDEAVRYLVRATELDPDSQRAFFDLGNLYRSLGDRDSAQMALVRSQELLGELRKKQEIEQAISAGEEALQRSDLEAAARSFTRVIELDPNNWAAHNRLTKIHFARNQETEAIKHAEALLRIDPESSEANFIMAAHWSARREFTKALEFAEKSKQLRPGDPAARKLLGDIYFATGQKLKAIEEFGAASRLNPIK
ncbi:MAG: tetratricopeptide repeat protein [Acidobacteriota bacterium]|nr:MAG: tetratricopeptide repeat protein [Acidobacteriota bacterium]